MKNRKTNLPVMSNRRRSELEHGFHGGDLADAMGNGTGVDGNKQEHDWLDLSTGISPYAYPIPDMSFDIWKRLPGRVETGELLAAAADYYGAPDIAHIAAAPGSQALIQILPYCLPKLPVTVVGPTYSGHVCGWQAAGREVRTCTALEECDPSGITVLVNPNNPDGCIFPTEELAGFADRCTKAGGWLIVDEAYCDLDPSLSMAGQCDTQNVVVLRSFGKFFGLAGLRLGFAIAPLELTVRLRSALGSWAVSGPAIQLATQALRDFDWQGAQRETLTTSASRLDKALKNGGIAVRGGTDLFRLAHSPCVPVLFAHLLEHEIYVRRFDEHPEWLRFGLPGPEREWDKLDNALSSFRT